MVGDLTRYDERSSGGDSEQSASKGDGGSRVACDSATAIVGGCGEVLCCDDERPRKHVPLRHIMPLLVLPKAASLVRASCPRENALPCYFARAATSRR